ncbi:MAG: UDP-N-acetylglucosamine 1-carboxyvinyltransferase [Clostridia bacterium]|nr:UDP-N-acetylglucosamine 1-carboxyvinyltransferase [Clostridia bacterium]
MKKYIINGGKPLKGEVTISGAKNAVVGMIPATILADSPCTLENVPDIADVKLMIDILHKLGAEAYYKAPGVLYIDPTHINKTCVPKKLAEKMRASYYFVGALLSKHKAARAALPGGCSISEAGRGVDMHVTAFKALGAEVKIKENESACQQEQTDVQSQEQNSSDKKIDKSEGTIIAKATELRGAPIAFEKPSVGATINTMLCACKAKGLTTIRNAAKEPHIVDVANFLNTMGAKIRGAGTDEIRITGVDSLKGSTYTVIPDQIEAGTYMIMAAATKGDVLIKNVIPRHMECLTTKLVEMGVGVELMDSGIGEEDGVDDTIRVYYKGRPKATDIVAVPYPGFPTDLQAPTAALLTIADGTSTVTETIWSSRFGYTTELMKMGADIYVSNDNKTAQIRGVDTLTSPNPPMLKATDLRAGAAMIIAGLMTEGTTEITEIYHVERGYEKLIEKINAMGGDIRKEG